MNGIDFPVAKVLDGQTAAIEAGLTPVKITTWSSGAGSTRDRASCPMAAWARDIGATLRFIEYMDVGHSNGWQLGEVVPAQELIERPRGGMAGGAGRPELPGRGRRPVAIRGWASESSGSSRRSRNRSAATARGPASRPRASCTRACSPSRATMRGRSCAAVRPTTSWRRSSAASGRSAPTGTPNCGPRRRRRCRRSRCSPWEGRHRAVPAIPRRRRFRGAGDCAAPSAARRHPGTVRLDGVRPQPVHTGGILVDDWRQETPKLVDNRVGVGARWPRGLSGLARRANGEPRAEAVSCETRSAPAGSDHIKVGRRQDRGPVEVLRLRFSFRTTRCPWRRPARNMPLGARKDMIGVRCRLLPAGVEGWPGSAELLGVSRSGLSRCTATGRGGGAAADEHAQRPYGAPRA